MHEWRSPREAEQLQEQAVESGADRFKRTNRLRLDFGNFRCRIRDRRLDGHKFCTEQRKCTEKKRQDQSEHLTTCLIVVPSNQTAAQRLTSWRLLRKRGTTVNASAAWLRTPRAEVVGHQARII